MDSNKPPSDQKETPEENFYVHPEKESNKSFQYRLNKFRELLASRRKVIGSAFAVLLLAVSVGVGVYLTKQEHRTNVSAGSVDLTLTTSNANPQVGDTFTVAVTMNTNGSPVNAADIQVTYNSNLMTATSITNGGFLPATLIDGYVTTPGLAAIAVRCPIDTVAHPVTGSGLVAQVTFQAIKANTSKVNIGTNTMISVSGQPVNSLGVVTPVQITVVPATGPTPTPTKSPTPGPRTPSPTPTRSPSPTPRTPTPTPTISPTPGPRTPSPTPIAEILCLPQSLQTAVVNKPLDFHVADTGRNPNLIIWSAPQGIPNSGTGLTFTTIYNQPGNYSVTVTDGGPVTSCPVKINASPTPTPRTATPTPTPTRIPGDVNADGHVNIVDIGFVVDNYDTTPLLDPRCDLNGDGIANIVDIGIIVDHYEL